MPRDPETAAMIAGGVDPGSLYGPRERERPSRDEIAEPRHPVRGSWDDVELIAGCFAEHFGLVWIDPRKRAA